MICEMTFNYDKNVTTIRYPKKKFLDAGGMVIVEDMQKKMKGITTKTNSKYIYIELPFNLMNGEVSNETD